MKNSAPMAAGAISSTSVLNFISQMKKGIEMKPSAAVGKQ